MSADKHLTETQRLEDRIVTALATIRREWDHMLPTAAPAQRLGGGSRSAQITADDHADTDRDIDPATRLVSLRREVTTELQQWCRLVIEDRPITATAVDGMNVPRMCVFLETHARWLSGHRDAHEAADRIAGCAPGCEAKEIVSTHDCRGLVHHVRRWSPPPVTDRPRPPSPRLIGTCPLEWEDTDHDGRLVMRACEGRVLAYPTGLLDPTRAEQAAMRLPTCERCGTEAHVDWWYAQMYGDHGVSHLVTVHELIAVIAVRLDWIVSRDRIRKWQQRGKIATEGKDAKGRTLYRHDDVVRAVKDEIEAEKRKATA